MCSETKNIKYINNNITQYYVGHETRKKFNTISSSNGGGGGGGCVHFVSAIDAVLLHG